MAKITGSVEEKVFKISRWGGLHESPEGDTALKMGEAAVMRNFRITRDGNLQIRPGTKTIVTLDSPILGMWHGLVGGMEKTVCVSGGYVWSVDLANKTVDNITNPNIPAISTTNTMSFFGFGNKLYMLNGTDYYYWDGVNSVDRVDGYRPLVTITVTPSGGGTTLQQVNKLCGYRRSWFSPDGSATVFHLPETDISTLDWVKIRATNTSVPTTDYTADLAAGTVTFTTAPAKGVNTYEIGWTKGSGDRDAVTAMRFGEIFNGTTDNRVFIYGDGTNKAIYSGLDYDGNATADYFPDLNILDIGSENTPITSLIRHYSKLLAFKTDSTYTVRYGSITLDDSTVTAAFYTTPVNRTIGNIAPGQVQLVLNNPYSLFGSSVYVWKNNSSYSSNLTVDERQAKEMSQRVYGTLSDMALSSARAFDDNYHQEYYLSCGGIVLVHNYALDVWYKYTNLTIDGMIFVGEDVYISAGKNIKQFTRGVANDDGAFIDAYWRSGSIAFERDWVRKYSAKLYVSMEPEGQGKITVTIRTDRKSDFVEKSVSFKLATFLHMDFGRFSFNTNFQPHIEKLKIKAKKFAYYQLIFKSNETNRTATILSADIKVRYTGDVK